MSKNTWKQHWLLEAVRLKESQWGPIEDATEVRRIVAQGGSFQERLLLRAQLLAQRSGWITLQQRMWHIGSLLCFLFSLFFVLLGVGAATSALTSTDGSVNILLAIVTLLAIPSLSLLIWCASFVFFSPKRQGSVWGLGQLWLWLSRRIVKGPDQALLLNALLGFSRRQRLLQWGIGTLNHWLWLLALLSATVSVLILLAAKRYSFNWETTLLSADSFVMLVRALGVLPSFLGFVTPTEAIIRQSDGLQLLPAAVQVQWSSWLVGCLVVYGVLPRLIALGFSFFFLRARLGQLTVDSDLIGLIELCSRLMPQIEYVGIDAEAGADQVPEAEVLIARPALTASTVLIGVELAPDQAWPPLFVPTFWLDAGLVDSREQRSQLLAQLSQKAAEHLVLCVDAGQTPDRGVIAWLAELASYGKYCTVYLMNADKDELQLPQADRLEAWLHRLHKAGFTAIYTDFERLVTELD